MSAPGRTWRYRIVQQGSLPLRPDGRVDILAEHRCTTALVWPADVNPSAANAFLSDPCFTQAGYRTAEPVFAEVGITPKQLVLAFLSHRHHDHQPVLPGMSKWSDGILPWPDTKAEDCAVEVIPTPGHSRDSRSLVFRTEAGQQVWIVGDAILDREWLLGWGYYWPNLYAPEAIVETWRSVARILESADVIIPGHGEPIEVTTELLAALVENWPRAEYGERCPEVRDRIAARCAASGKE